MSAPTLLRPYSDLTPTLLRPYSELTPTLLRPYSDLTPTLLRPYSDLTPHVLRLLAANYECCGLGDCRGTTAARHPRSWTPTERERRRQYAARQMAAMEADGSLGWFYWNFKSEPPSEWSYLDGVRYGFVPRNATQPASATPPLCKPHTPVPDFCTATDPGCNRCEAREGHNETCRPFPPSPPAPASPPCPTSRSDDIRLTELSSRFGPPTAVSPTAVSPTAASLALDAVPVLLLAVVASLWWRRSRLHEQREMALEISYSYKAMDN